MSWQNSLILLLDQIYLWVIIFGSPKSKLLSFPSHLMSLLGKRIVLVVVVHCVTDVGISPWGVIAWKTLKLLQIYLNSVWSFKIKDTMQIRIVCLNKIHVKNIDNYVLLNMFYMINLFDTHYIAQHYFFFTISLLNIYYL